MFELWFELNLFCVFIIILLFTHIWGGSATPMSTHIYISTTPHTIFPQIAKPHSGFLFHASHSWLLLYSKPLVAFSLVVSSPMFFKKWHPHAPRIRGPEKAKPFFLHIYGQRGPMDPVRIVGDFESLKLLHSAIGYAIRDEAFLQYPRTNVNTQCSDGVGFSVGVELSKDGAGLLLPYFIS